ncbi:hypothetical protein pb186bvf_001835 [Paramecium bursaria]
MTEFCRNIPGFFNGCGQFSKCILNSAVGRYQCYHISSFDIIPSVGVIYAIMPFVMGISIIGGLGGGPLKGPFLEVLLNYSQTESTHIAYCLMFGSAILNSIILFFERHPYNNKRPIINFQIAIIYNLAIPMASNFGSSLQDYLPQLYILLLTIGYLAIICPIIWTKGIDENNIFQAQQQKNIEIQLQSNDVSQQRLMLTDALNESNHQENSAQIKLLEDELNSKFPIIPITLILFSFTLNQVIIQMRATPRSESIIGLKACTWQNDMMILVLIFANIIYTTIVWFYGRKKELQMDQYKFNTEERYFTPFTRFALIYLGGFGAGFTSSILGLGAGFIMVPTMLQAGLVARCASSTSAVNNLMISLTNLITLLTEKLLTADTIYLFTGLAMIGGLFVTKLFYFLMNKYKIGYIVIFIVFWLGIINILSSIYYGIVTGKRYGIQTLTELQTTC